MLRKPTIKAAWLRILEQLEVVCSAGELQVQSQPWHTQPLEKNSPQRFEKSLSLLLQASLQNLTSDVKKPEHVHRETLTVMSSTTSLFILFLHQSLPISGLSFYYSVHQCSQVETPFYSVIVCSAASRNLRLDYGSKVLL